MDGKNYFLDTNIVVPFLNGDAVIAQKIDGLEAVHLPITVLGELYYGAMKSTRPQENRENSQGFARQCRIYPIDEEAALAKTYHFPIVTRDRHFVNVPSIEVISW